MSDGLIERLREMRENWKAAYLSLASLTFGEAADRIEELEAALHWISNNTATDSVHHAVAREALAGKAEQ